jgi:hypothetical protein
MAPINDESKTIDVVYGYDFKVDNHQICLNIARDLIMALLTFDKIYIEADHILDILRVFGSEAIINLLRLHILNIIPDKNLTPVMIREKTGEWKHDFISYPLGNEDILPQQIHKWSHVEYQLSNQGLNKKEKNAIIYLVDENSVEIGNENDLQKRIIQETERDRVSTPFLADPNFCRCRPDGKLEYNQVSINRLHELNKSAVLSAELGIDNVKMDAEISNIMLKKVSSVFSIPLHEGTDVLIRIEQQKGFPDLGELYINKIINFDEILNLRDSFNGKIFRYWAKASNYEEDLMRQEIMNSVKSMLGSKCLQPIRLLACNLLGLGGFLPGLAASAFDSYILEKILIGWHPNFFLDNDLKKMIDSSVEEKERQNKDMLRKQMFKGVGRNDLCPCGSGKKFKNCHGRDLD